LKINTHCNYVEILQVQQFKIYYLAVFIINIRMAIVSILLYHSSCSCCLALTKK
jgi:hypothetical protein